MRGGFSAALEQRLRRADPTAKLYVEAHAVVSGDLKTTKDEWDAADSITGFSTSFDGVRLSATAGVTIEDTNAATTYITDLDQSTPFLGAVVEWKGSDPSDLPVYSVTAYLDPAHGGAQTVVTWRGALFVLLPAAQYVSSPKTTWEVGQIADWVDVTAGVSAGNVTFDFSNIRPTPKTFPIPGNGYTAPTMVVLIQAVDANGAPASNVGWGVDGGNSSITTSSNVLTGKRFTGNTDGTWSDGGGVGGVPVVTIKAQGYVTATITWSTNKPDLGAVPASADVVEFTIQGEVPTGTTLTADARVSGGDAWTPVLDGQTAADVGLAASQTYQMRATLTTDSTSSLTPLLTAIGVREVTITDLSDVATARGGGWGFDPPTLAGQVAQVTITALRDGEADFRDAITTLVSTTDIGSLMFRLMIGAPDLDRDQWLVLDDFSVDDISGVAGALVVTAVGPTAQLAGTRLPTYNSGTSTRALLTYTNQGLKTVYDDLLANQLAVAGRLIGPEVEDDSTQVTKQISDSDGLTELNAIAFLAGGAVISSQGRIKFVDVFGDKAAVGVLPFEEAAYGLVSPGWRQRVPEYYIDYAYNYDTQVFDGEARAEHGSALTKLGRALLDPPRLPDETAKWIPSLTLAQTVGNRIIQHLGTGQITLQVRSSYAHPEWEPGDIVLVRTDRFVAKSPTDDRAIKGYTWMAAMICDVGDLLGTQFTFWVRSYSDVLGSTSDVTLSQLPVQVLYSSYLGTVGTDITDFFAFGHVGAPAASNPYYAWRLNAATPPTAALIGYDGTTTRTFLTADFGANTLTLTPATTLSGLLTAQAGITVSGGSVVVTGALAGSEVFASKVTGDTIKRFSAIAGGQLQWGDGTNPRDTNLYRNTADELKTDDALKVAGLLTAQAGFSVTGGTIAASGIAATVGALTATGAITASGQDLLRGTAASSLRISGSTAFNVGANILLFGESHATQANDIAFRVATGNRLLWDDSAAAWSFQSLAVSMGALTATTGSFTDTTDATAYNAASLKTAGGLGIAKDLFIGTLGRFDSTSVPDKDDVLRYNGTKWVPTALNFRAFSGQMETLVYTDNTASAEENDGRTLSGAVGATPSAPTVTADYLSAAIDMGSVPPANVEYQIHWSTDAGSTWSDDSDSSQIIETTGSACIHTRLDPALTYIYQVRKKGSTTGSWSASSTGITPSTDAYVNVVALAVFSQLATVNLAANAAAFNTITGGILENAALTHGILLSGLMTDTDPSGWNRWINFVDETADFIHTEYVSIGHDKHVTFTDGTHTLFTINTAGTSAYWQNTTGDAGLNIMGTAPSGWKTALDLADGYLKLSVSGGEVLRIGDVSGIIGGTRRGLYGAWDNSNDALAWCYDDTGAYYDLYLQNRAATAGIVVDSSTTRGATWNTKLDLKNRIFVVNDGTYDRVQAGLIGSYYGFQIKDSSGNTSLDAARSDGRLFLQAGKSTTLAPAALLLFEDAGVSTSSSSEASITSYSLPANVLGTDNDVIRITVLGFSATSTNSVLKIKFGSTVVATLTGFTDQVNATVFIKRTGASTQLAKGIVQYMASGVVQGVHQVTAPTETLSGAVTVDFRGNITTGGSLTLDFVSIEYLGPP